MLPSYCLLTTVYCLLLQQPDTKKANEKIKEVAGTAEFLRSIPKHFGILKGIDRANRKVTILVEGETQPQTWALLPDAEIKLAGWWARLDQLRQGERVWIWMHLDRLKQPTAIAITSRK